VLALATLLPTRALAAGPTVQRISYTQTGPAPVLSATCGFTVMRTDVVNINISTYPDGTILSAPAGPNTRTFFTVYGSFTARFAGINLDKTNPDGTITVVETGPSLLGTVPRDGIVSGFSGADLGILDPATGTFTPIADSLTSFWNYPVVCTFLGPPGYQFPD
jgi:hypothetical protein